MVGRETTVIHCITNETSSTLILVKYVLMTVQNDC